jgi:hypothetical protein
MAKLDVLEIELLRYLTIPKRTTLCQEVKKEKVMMVGDGGVEGNVVKKKRKNTENKEKRTRP